MSWLEIAEVADALEEPPKGSLINEAMKAEGAELATLLRALDDEPPPETGVLGR